MVTETAKPKVDACTLSARGAMRSSPTTIMVMCHVTAKRTCAEGSCRRCSAIQKEQRVPAPMQRWLMTSQV